jgi:hypothetical protein
MTARLQRRRNEAFSGTQPQNFDPASRYWYPNEHRYKGSYTMQHSRENQKTKQSARKGAVKRTSSSKAQDSLPKKMTKSATPATAQPEATAPSTGPVLSQEEYRARVARKAFELYQKRRALTEVDDWIEAERLVKLELLDEQRGAIA